MKIYVKFWVKTFEQIGCPIGENKSDSIQTIKVVWHSNRCRPKRCFPYFVILIKSFVGNLPLYKINS